MFRCLYMKRTTETKTESKLGTGLEHKTLKFIDYAIFKFQSDFIYFFNFNRARMFKEDPEYANRVKAKCERVEK